MTSIDAYRYECSQHIRADGDVEATAIRRRYELKRRRFDGNVAADVRRRADAALLEHARKRRVQRLHGGRAGGQLCRLSES